MSVDSGPLPAELGIRADKAPKTTELPEAAKAGEVRIKRLGTDRPYGSFSGALDVKLAQHPRDEQQGPGVRDAEQTKADAEALFTKASEQLAPQVVEIIAEMKRLGINKDILAPAEFGLLAHGLKADQLGEVQAKDRPFIKDEKYEPDPLNPLYEITVGDDGQVKIVPEKPTEDAQKAFETFLDAKKALEKIADGESILNTDLNTSTLEGMLTRFRQSSTEFAADPLLASDPKLRQWVEQQAISRNVLLAKGELQPQQLSLEGATVIKNLSEEAAQASNDVLLMQTPDGRKLVAKRGPIHTLQAEVLENRAMAAMGLPVPETYIEDVDGEPVLVVGFLDGHFEEKKPFKLTEKYHTNRVLQRGMIVDIWMGQYNRRPHNVMMKDGKMGFIDHGGAAFCRASGGFKEFDADVSTTNIWDMVRTIPDNDKNGDVAVNEAYAKILTVHGGRDGDVVVRDPSFLQGQLKRLGQMDREQITSFVEAAGYEDGKESIDQMLDWINSDDIAKKITELQATIDSGNFTAKDERDLRWTEGAKQTLEAAIAAGGMRTYMIDTLEKRRDAIIEYLEPHVRKAMSEQHRPEKRETDELIDDPEAFKWEKVIPELQAAKARGQTVVITNGHFVLSHPGHSVSLEQAAKVGVASRADKKRDGVVVLAIVNSDHQTMAKGSEKGAAQPAHERAINIHDNRHSDIVAISEAPEGDSSLVTDFQRLAEAGIIDEDTIYVKGGDYSADENDDKPKPPEANIVISNGGVFKIVERKGSYSTSSIVERITDSYRRNKGGISKMARRGLSHVRSRMRR